mmetsp:Transcript_36423/g.116735  ORF Transcript_36423/g.116735 Transcript_36423/m.116735 type:complete len:552 (-) Transcript_36423:2531-4186(-)
MADTTTTESSEKKKETKKKGSSTIFSEVTFDALPLTAETKGVLASMKFSRMTKIQALAIPPLLEGKDVVGKAKTGSGKTLAFLVPLVEFLVKSKFQRRHGTGAIVVAPTRELALQTFEVLKNFHAVTSSIAMGGANKRTEAERLAKGSMALVATPGRLLDHLNNTKGFVYKNLLTLVVDEADRILDEGFEDDLRGIIAKLAPSQARRQTMLFSATNTSKVEDLARFAVKSDPVYVGLRDDEGRGPGDDDDDEALTVSSLKQGYVIVKPEDRFRLLLTFVKRHRLKNKIMVFCSSCNAVKFYSDLLNYVDVPVSDIHGKQKQSKRTSTFFDFCKAKTGVLLCTDVAARGLDIPKVDWIIQYDPPDDPREYIHRVGRTARGADTEDEGKDFNALMFLMPEELGFLKYLKSKTKAKLVEYDVPSSKIANVQAALTRLVERNYYLHKAARDGYRSYLLAYASHSHKDIFNVHALDLAKISTSFGFAVPPRIDLNLSARGDKATRRKKKRNDLDEMMEGQRKKKHQKSSSSSSGHAFSAANPYGKKDAGDRRQWSK